MTAAILSATAIAAVIWVVWSCRLPPARFKGRERHLEYKDMWK